MYTPKESEQEQARDLYLRTDMTQSEIAKHLGVNRKTISDWAKKNNWYAIKKASLQSPAKIADDLYKEIGEINLQIQSRQPGLRFPTPQEAETRRKIITSIQVVKKQFALSEVQQLLYSFLNYVQSKDQTAYEGIRYRIRGFLETADEKGYKPYDTEYNVSNGSFMSFIQKNEEEEHPEEAQNNPETPSQQASQENDSLSAAA